MRAMLLAAGRGTRMRSLSDATPKALMLVHHKPLIVYHLEALARAGITECVINLGYLGEKIAAQLGDGSAFKMAIEYSYEDPVLETGGGVYKALPLLGKAPFILVSSDIFTDFPFERLTDDPKGLLHVVLVDNPQHHLGGDFSLVEDQVVTKGAGTHVSLNYGGIGVYRPELFEGSPEGPFPLSLLYKKAIQLQAITGEHYRGVWHNVGTPEQLYDLNSTTGVPLT